MSYEVNEPILNSPFGEPSRYWFIREGYHPELKYGRRPAIVYPPREGNTEWELGEVKQWREQNYPGASHFCKNRRTYTMLLK